MRADRGARLLADDRQHRHMVEPRVIQPGQQVRRPGPRGREADAQFTGKLRMSGGHERCHFLMTDLHEFELIRDLLKRTEQPIDAVAGIAEDAPHSPLVQPIPEKFTDGLRHIQPFPASACADIKRVTVPWDVRSPAGRCAALLVRLLQAG